ncbi:unnamed protein product [Mycena citricolor]|uniref:Endonuclease/exonuclease/phosphatase domain-containing protein n=1 Tax=Mycena citricolor TaxID=2018698 RepID=A0AAD2HQQ0_9AGAR|nr:unnamed protein product [Mycena citricolor]
MSKRPQLTPEQIALSEARKAKKLKLQSDPSEPALPEKSRILRRPWIELDRPGAKDAQQRPGRFSLLTWNVLAQCLVRRSLFPTSTCLKGAQRQPMIQEEILYQDADILCLQEVDGLDKLLPVLEKEGYRHHYASGPGKKHGCLIAFKNTYEKIGDRLVLYDEQDVRRDGEDKFRRGSSFRTKNIGSLVALRCVSDETRSVIVGTTHLFWHPRQAGILLRDITKYRADLGHGSWHCILAGDFNFTPEDPAYSLLVGRPLTQAQSERLDISRVVHVSLDPSVPVSGPRVADEDEGDDPDLVITNARRAVPADGLLSDAELSSLFASSGLVRSAYNEGLHHYRQIAGDIGTFGERLGWVAGSKGFHEPEYTSYTHWWKSVLDYIFFVEPRPLQITGFRAPHVVKNMELGLPQTGICGSDHISLCAEFRESVEFEALGSDR